MSSPTTTTIAVVLTAAVLAISSSAVLVRGMEAEPLAIAAWRTTGACALLAPAWLRSGSAVSRADRWKLLLAGLALGGHFAVWFASLQLTSVLRSTLLVCTTPLWAGLLDTAITGQWPRRRFLLGLALALVGVAMMIAVERPISAEPEAAWSGDLLATSGAMLAAIYLRLSQSVRQRLGAPATMGWICGVAAVALWMVVLLQGTRAFGFPQRTWMLLAAAVLGPQLIGHQGFTWAVRWLPAAKVALVVLLEPLGAAILAAVFLAEVPAPVVWVGGAVSLTGLAVAVYRPSDARGSTAS